MKFRNVSCSYCGNDDFRSKGYFNNKRAIQCKNCLKKTSVLKTLKPLENNNKEAIEKEGDLLSCETEQDGVQKTTILLKLNSLRNKSPNDIMLIHGYDPLQWEFLSHQYKNWNSYSKKDGIQDLYSSTIKVKPIQKILDIKSLGDVFDNLKFDKFPEHKVSNKQGNKLLEIPIMDFHLGKLSWEDETGFNYDLKIAEELFKKHFIYILNKIQFIKKDIEEVVFPIGQDFFNIDNDKNTTNRGTEQDVDGRWQKIFQKGVELNIWAIESLIEKGFSNNINVFYVSGNHDKIFSYFLVNSLNFYFKMSEIVNVDVSPKVRKYYKYGKNMLCFTHGMESKKQLDKIIQAEEPVMWGETIFRELHLGHLHSESLIEYPGFKIRRIGSLVSSDRWHYESGFIGALRSLQVFIWDKDRGLEYIIQSNEFNG